MTRTGSEQAVIRRQRDSERLWGAGAFLISSLVAAPIIAVGIMAFTPAENIWPHLIATVLPGYIYNTVVLMVGIGIVTFVVGTSCAWLATTCRFPGRKTLKWALLVPLATPTYIIAYTYVDVFEYSGFVQASLRDLFGWQSREDYMFPEIRSLGGAIFVMSFVLYPYVYLTARAAFIRQSGALLEISRTLGTGPWGTFFKVALPLARPALAVGVALACMESLNDIGAVEFFGVNTLTVGIYNTWLERSNLGGAAQIACVMLLIVFALVWIERLMRQRQRFFDSTGRDFPARPVKLTGVRAYAATVACSLPILFGFVVPGLVLLDFAIGNFSASFTGDYLKFARNSLILSGLSALLAVAVGLFLAYAYRLARTNVVQITIRFANVGYAVPGAVLGIGILTPLAQFDNALDMTMRSMFGISTGLILTGTIFSVCFAYLVRFLAVSYGALESGLHRITPNLDMAARTLGRTAGSTLRDVHLPLIRPALATAGLLVFVDCMKELPATLLLRPFNFDTLATHVYTLASLELLEESALSALTIVLVGIIPVVLLSRTLRMPKRSAAEPVGTDLTFGPAAE
jgi:iron(III) transport system permease protein